MSKQMYLTAPAEETQKKNGISKKTPDLTQSKLKFD